ncbi:MULTISPECIES: hypothetical protein [Streptomyces]|uniref:hypothetical protein n=1 Tax=Streptomyces TaxID=1883 RepID=UPI000A6D9689|nr:MULTISPECIES: hypothetical protein [Streptomyces]
MATPASTTDQDAARPLLPAGKERFRRPCPHRADGDYTGHLIDWAAQHLGLIVEVVRRSDDAHGFQILPRR